MGEKRKPRYHEGSQEKFSWGPVAKTLRLLTFIDFGLAMYFMISANVVGLMVTSSVGVPLGASAIGAFIVDR